MPPPWIAVIFLGSVGVALRFAFIHFCENLASPFPWATFLSNSLGCLLAGAFLSCLSHCHWPGWVNQSLTIGFLGGLTTFSGLIVDAHRLWCLNRPFFACFYLLLTLGVGILLFAAGITTIRRIMT